MTCPSSGGIEKSRRPWNARFVLQKIDPGRFFVPKFREKSPFHFRKSVNLLKPVDQRAELIAKCLEMSPILPFLPLNPHQPAPKGGEGAEGLKKRFPSVLSQK